MTDQTPDHSSLTRIRQRIDLETHEAVFTCVLQALARGGLLMRKLFGLGKPRSLHGLSGDILALLALLTRLLAALKRMWCRGHPCWRVQNDYPTAMLVA